MTVTSARLPPSCGRRSHSRRVSELHGLVHNAGDIHPIKPLFGADTADWTRSMMVNLVGVRHLTQAGSALGQAVSGLTISSGAAFGVGVLVGVLPAKAALHVDVA